MGTNTLVTAVDGTPIPAAHPNQYKTALTNDIVPRNYSGIPTDEAGSLGTDTYQFGNVKFKGRLRNNGSEYLPVGTVIHTIFPAASEGFLLANGDTIGNVGSGATHENADFEELFELCKSYFGNAGTEDWALGNTVLLPDFRGEHIRAWDNGRGIDSGRTINSSQTDQNKAHTHQITDGATTVYDASGGGGGNSKMSLSATVDTSAGVLYSNSSGGTEVRVRNYALNYMIKY